MPKANSTRGAVAGCIGAIDMTAWFFAARVFVSVPTPSEMFADRSAPFISVHPFGILIGVVHCYEPLKILGFSSVVLAQIVVGAAAGFAYAVVRALVLNREPGSMATPGEIA